MERYEEPWSYDFYNNKIKDKDGHMVLGLHTYHQDDARRLVACVNACAGIDTEKLEGKTIADYVASEAYINEMGPSEGSFGISLNGLACQMLAASFAGQFVANGGINHLEVAMQHKEIGPFTVTIQRTHGKTPGQLKAEAEQQRNRLLAEIKAAREEMSCCNINSAAERLSHILAQAEQEGWNGH